MPDEFYTVVGWKTIPFASCYEISTEGKVRRCKIANYTTKGKPQGQIGKVLHNCGKQGTYPYVKLRCDNGKHRRYHIHNLLGIVFLKKPTGIETHVAHYDDDKSNYRLSNFSWKTPVQNADDSRRNGKKCVGNTHKSIKIPDEALPEIRAFTGSAKILARKFGVSRQTITRIRSGTERRSLPILSVNND